MRVPADRKYVSMLQYSHSIRACFWMGLRLAVNNMPPLTGSSSHWRPCRGHRRSTRRWSAHGCCWSWRRRRWGWCKGRGPRLLAGTCPGSVCTGTSWWSSTPSALPLLHGWHKDRFKHTLASDNIHQITGVSALVIAYQSGRAPGMRLRE